MDQETRVRRVRSKWHRLGVKWDELDGPTRAVLSRNTQTARLRHPSVPTSIKGHAYQVLGNGRWCECGHYLGGLEFVTRWSPRDRHELHRAVVTARMAREIPASDDTGEELAA